MGRDPNFWRWNIVRSVIIVFGEPVDVVVVDVQYAGDVADASPTRTSGPEQGPPRKMRKPCCLGNVLGGDGNGRGGGKVLLSYLFRHGRLLPTFVSLPQVCQVSDNWH